MLENRVTEDKVVEVVGKVVPVLKELSIMP
jgi:hypothetical protein